MRHGHGKSRPRQQLDIIVAVTETNHIGSFDGQPRREGFHPARLVGARRKELDDVFFGPDDVEAAGEFALQRWADCGQDVRRRGKKDLLNSRGCQAGEVRVLRTPAAPTVTLDRKTPCIDRAPATVFRCNNCSSLTLPGSPGTPLSTAIPSATVRLTGGPGLLVAHDSCRLTAAPGLV